MPLLTTEAVCQAGLAAAPSSCYREQVAGSLPLSNAAVDAETALDVLTADPVTK